MINYFQILGLPFDADKETVEKAYQKKLMQLFKIGIYDRQAINLTKLKWEYTLPLLSEWKMLSHDANTWREFLTILHQDNSGISSLISSETKKQLSDVSLTVPDDELIKNIHKTFLALAAQIEQKLCLLKQINNAYSVLKYDSKKQHYQHYSLFFKAVNDSVSATLPPEISELITGYAL
jgi:hypothetical protein